MGGIHDEGQLLDERFRIHSRAGMERRGEWPRAELVTDDDVIRLVTGDGGRRSGRAAGIRAAMETSLFGGMR